MTAKFCRDCRAFGTLVGRSRAYQEVRGYGTCRRRTPNGDSYFPIVPPDGWCLEWVSPREAGS